MAWLAILLIGISVTDLAHSVRPVKVIPEVSGAVGALVAAIAVLGMPTVSEALGIAAVVAAVLAWGQTVTWAFGPGGKAWVPLLVLGVVIGVAVLCLPIATRDDGPLRDWVAGLSRVGEWPNDSPVAAAVMLVLALSLVQLSSGNVIVRLALRASGTSNPAHHGEPPPEHLQLKGGRLLGPLERLFIFWLALTGNLVAAGVVIAAKGLLRFPELQSERDQQRIHKLTEYFLVGSFLSWGVALMSVGLWKVGALPTIG